MKQTYIHFPNTVEVHTKTITTSAAGQRKASFTLDSIINVRVQSGSGSRVTSGYLTEADSYTVIFSHEDKALAIYANRLKNLKDIEWIEIMDWIIVNKQGQLIGQFENWDECPTRKEVE